MPAKLSKFASLDVNLLQQWAIGIREAGRLGMVRRISEICVQDSLPMREQIPSVGGFRGNKHRIDFCQYGRIVKSHFQQTLSCILVAQDSEAVRDFSRTSSSAPHVEHNVSSRLPGVL